MVDEAIDLKGQDGIGIIVYAGAGFVSTPLQEGLLDEFNFIVNPSISIEEASYESDKT